MKAQVGRIVPGGSADPGKQLGCACPSTQKEDRLWGSSGGRPGPLVLGWEAGKALKGMASWGPCGDTVMSWGPQPGQWTTGVAEITNTKGLCKGEPRAY